MSVQNQVHQEQKFTGKHMLAIMIAFFGVIIAVNIFMATKARGTWTGLVVKNSYVASQQYNSQLKEAEALRASGLRSDLAYESGKLSFILKDRAGSILPLSDAIIEIGRPAYEQADQTFALIPSGDGSYVLAIDLDRGAWAVKISGQNGETKYRRDARIFVQSDGRGMVE